MWKIVLIVIALGIEHIVTYFLMKRAVSSSFPPYPASGVSVLSPEALIKLKEEIEDDKAREELLKEIEKLLENNT